MSIRPGSQIDTDVKKVRSTVEGTTSVLKCGIHDFETEDPAEYDRHLHSEDGHYEHGYTPCMVCGKPYHFTIEHKVQTKHVKRGIAMHPACKEEFFQDIQK